MDSDDDDQMYLDESDEEMSDDDELNMVMEPEVSSTTDEANDDDFPHQVLTAADIVQHMIDCIQEVNTIVEVSNLFPIISDLIYLRREMHEAYFKCIQLHLFGVGL